MAIKFLVDEQINPRVAKALRVKDVDASSIHDLGLAGQGFQDEPLLKLAISRQATLLTLDADFLRIHSEWQERGKEHCGIFYGETSKYQAKAAIEILVNFCSDWHQFIAEGAGTLEEDVYNKLEYIQEL